MKPAWYVFVLLVRQAQCDLGSHNVFRLQLVDFTDEMYEDDLRTDPRQLASPYCFIYADYERKWAFYKVVVMIIKLILAVLVVALSDKVVLQTCISLGVLVVMIGFAFYSTPLLNSQADTMEISGRIANAFTVFFGMLGSKDVAPGTSTVMGILINTVSVGGASEAQYKFTYNRHRRLTELTRWSWCS